MGRGAPTTGLARSREEWANALTHAAGSAGVLLAAPAMLATAAPGIDRLSVGLFTAALLIVFTSSACHHWALTRRVKQAFLFADHISIYLLIAGTYTPLAVLALPAPAATALLFVAWAAATVGLLATSLAFGSKRTALYERHCHWLHLAVGWLPLAAYGRTLTTALPQMPFNLILMGCAAYSGGVVIYLNKSFRWHHAGWHVATLIGAGCHAAAVAALLGLNAL